MGVDLYFDRPDDTPILRKRIKELEERVRWMGEALNAIAGNQSAEYIHRFGAIRPYISDDRNVAHHALTRRSNP